MKRIFIVGTSCSGKTTLGINLAKIIKIPATDIDNIYWRPNWEHISKEELLEEIDKVTSEDSWIICGNYSAARELILNRADTVIWLNYSFPVTWSRALRRTLRRSFTQETCCNGNTESFRQSFMSKDSILWWVLKTYSKRKREYKTFREDPKYSSINFKTMNSPLETSNWLKNLE